MTKDTNKRITIVKICFITVPKNIKRYHVLFVEYWEIINQKSKYCLIIWSRFLNLSIGIRSKTDTYREILGVGGCCFALIYDEKSDNGKGKRS